MATEASIELCIFCSAVIVIACQRTAFCQFGRSVAFRRHLQPTRSFLCNSSILQTVQQLWRANWRANVQLQEMCFFLLITTFKMDLLQVHVLSVSACVASGFSSLFPPFLK